ncbi:MAG TPA: poly-gamma-glutamate hydrolase family protein [Acidimicrobiales bacterium]|nr:poly-gamma-glutamate hydrolase family protein [Acidimicrobiales bacterium]
MPGPPARPLPTREVTWPALLAHPAVREHCQLGSPVGLLAFHAGLEAGTGEVARAAAAASGASLYLVDQPADLRWHVASAEVDPAGSAALRAFLGHVVVAVAVHGYGRRGPGDPVLVGGRARRAAAVVAGHLRAALPGVEVVDDLGAIPAALRGVHPRNPVNRPPGGGVQVELPVGVRRRAAAQVAAALAAAALDLGGQPD